MGGGLMQLVAYGAQDIYLTGNPQITFFKSVYRRHTNFACEAIEQTFNGTADFGRKVSATVSRNGDLIGPTYLQFTLPALPPSTAGPDAGAAAMGLAANEAVGWTNSVGHALINNVEVEVGGQKIDKHYGEWMEIWTELTLNEEKRDGFNNMVGRYETKAAIATNGNDERTYYVPLQFWFCRNPGKYLPLIALQYHEVKINFEFRPVLELVNTFGTVAGTTPAAALITGVRDSTNAAMSLKDTSLWVDYIYLDTDERRRFAQVSHEYLIEQLQFTGSESVAANATTSRVRLNFNHPVKELVWVHRRSANGTSNANTGNEWFNFSNQDTDQSNDDNAALPGVATDLLASAKLLLNGHDRFATRKAGYFRLVQPWQHHTRIPGKHVYVYSFGLKPEEDQPSGTVNMSRIDNATLELNLVANADTSEVLVYAPNYNVFRIMSGMGGLAYSN
jgi:hypothetical protein